MTLTINKNNIIIKDCIVFLITSSPNMRSVDLSDFAFKEAVIYFNNDTVNVARIRLDQTGEYDISECTIEFVNDFSEIDKTDLYRSLL